MIADLRRAACLVLEPLVEIPPSEWAAKYRSVNGGPFPGPWDNDNAPYLVGWMDAVKEAIDRGLRGVVGMKSAQGAGSEALGINTLGWLITYYPGPYLYLTAKDEIAEEFSRDRWVHVLSTCPPLKRKHLAGKTHGEKIQVKRFTDAKLVLAGSKSPNNYISSPYRGYVLDEHDAVMDVLPGGADPLAMLDERRAAWAEGGSTIGITLAHPTRKDRGAGKLYYNESDQRRGHVVCPHCQAWCAPLWENVKVVPRAGQTDAEAERDPSCYAFFAPCCGAQWSEADRLVAIRRVEQRSTLPPEIAREKRWIGIHFWRFFMKGGGSIPVMAEQFVAALDDPAKMKVFVNQVTGDVLEEKTDDVSVEAWHALKTPEGTTGSFPLGEVPPEVQFLTAGQDSRLLELHWAVWGWGLTRAQGGGSPLLRGWLVDAGVEAGPKAGDPRRGDLQAHDLDVFRQVLYQRTWPRFGGGKPVALVRGLHDVGWQPIGVYEFCRSIADGRAVPSRGGPYDDHSRAPPTRQSEPIAYAIGTATRTDPNFRRLEMNTYHLKTSFASLAVTKFKDQAGVPLPRLALPFDAPDELLAHLASERVKVEKGKRRWVKRGPNHWWDCSIMAYAAALIIQALTPARTREEAKVEAQAQRAIRRSRRTGEGHAIRTEY